MRVKEISVQGFKSFANRHRFVFPTGITAIVGPNGSGKSNVADAIRWVLGEQRATNLRAKRTEDIIFAGTEKRARSGMAQVSVTFDNEDGWLDLDFPEVTISRRAARDGTSQLLVNDAVVRLRDVLDLLGGRLGQGNYTVIGQGMVDSALALRPEDRRALVDEAAGLLPLQRKRDRSLRKLAETDENLTRVRDILEETGPRLRRLARLADRAARHREVAEQLRASLETWYGHHWYRARDARDHAHREVQSIRAEVDRARAALEGAIARRRSQEQALERSARELAELRASHDALLRSDAEARQAVAVGRVRLEGLRGRREDLVQEAAARAERLASLEAIVDARGAQLVELDRQAELREQEAAEARGRLAQAETEREARAREVETARAEVLRQRARREALRERQATLVQELEQQRAARDRAADELEALSLRRERAEAGRTEAEADLQQQEGNLQAAAEAQREAEAERDRVDRSLREARDALALAEAEVQRLRARSDALEAHVGELDETEQVLQRLSGTGSDAPRVVGTVRQLVEVAEDWEAALAAALGPAVQGIVLEDAAALDAALRLLRPDARGQLVLVELETAGALADPPVPPAGALPAAGALSSSTPGLARALVGDSLLVEDLPAGRAALAAAPAYRRAATRDGLLLHRGGRVLSGSPAQRILELERERRRLPAAMREAGRRTTEAQTAVDEALGARERAEQAIAERGRERVEAAQARTEAQRRLERASSELDRAVRERDWAEEHLSGLDRRLTRLDEEARAAEQHLEESQPEQQRLETELESASAELRSEELGELREAVAESAARASAASQARAGHRALLEAAERDLRLAREAITAAEGRAAETGSEIESLEGEVARLEGRAGSQHDELAELQARIAPAESARSELQQQLRDMDEGIEAARAKLAEQEARLSEARVAATRTEDRLERLFDQLRSDEEWLPLELPEQLELGASLEIPLPRIDLLPEDGAEELGRLRRQMRAIGSIDQEALAAYSETAERHEMLTEQEADLVAAERDLRQLLETLEGEMRLRFEETFGAVARAFAEFFPMLFGGGEAELVLEGDDAAQAGLDIMARPPGKRRQPLGLLSGGERALTAVALIFALLQVSQTPFVVLDEVDAALDEANVNRFCAALDRLSEAIQVVVITHNRGTIETAGTVYGVTMAEDGASQIISLRVDAIA